MTQRIVYGFDIASNGDETVVKASIDDETGIVTILEIEQGPS